LAIHFGIVSWEKGSAESAAKALFEIWRKAQPQTQKSKEHAQILERVLDFINAHADSRFSDINWAPFYHPQHGYVTNPQPIIRDRAGYWEQCDPSSPRIYLFTSGGLKEATKGFPFKRVLKALDEAGAFTTKKGSKGEKAMLRTIPGENRQEDFYHIDPSQLRI
jgi:putative DNA primase/helicase